MVEDKVPVEKRKGAIKKLLTAISSLEDDIKEDTDIAQDNKNNVLNSLNKIKKTLSTEPVPSSKEIMAANQELESNKSYLCYLYSNCLQQI